MASDNINPGFKGMRLESEFHSFDEVVSNERAEIYKKAAEMIRLIVVEVIVESGQTYKEEQENGSLITNKMSDEQKKVRVNVINSENRLAKFWLAVDDIEHQQDL